MNRKTASVIAVFVTVAALLPSAWIAWHFRAMPQMGAYHDDAVYLESAKSLAEGHDYRIPSLPDAPYQTKYPPVFPFLMSLIWRIDPQFPGNLSKLAALCYAMLPIYVALLFVVLRRWGLSPLSTAAICAVTALSPHMVLASTMTMSEMTFGVLSLIAILFLERGTAERNYKLVIFAGIAGGLAFLTRTQGIALLASGLAVFAWKKEWANAAGYAAPFGLAVVGWVLWTHTHGYRGSDPVTLYYVDYVRFYSASVQWSDLPRFLQVNIDSIFSNMAHLLFAALPSDTPGRMFGWVMAVASISGLRRLVKQSGQYHIAAFALGAFVLLLPWNWPPNERYLIPIWPAIAAGFLTEFTHLFSDCRAGLKRPEFGQRAVSAVMLAGVAAIACIVPYRNFDGTMNTIPAIYSDYQKTDASREPGYEWIRKNTPENAQLLTYDDPLVYLHTGRRGIAMPTALHWLMDGDNDKRLRVFFSSAPAFMQEHRLDYVLSTDTDFHRDLLAQGRDAFQLAVNSDTGFEPLFTSQGVKVYRLKSETSSAPAPMGAWFARVRQTAPSIQ